MKNKTMKKHLSQILKKIKKYVHRHFLKNKHRRKNNYAVKRTRRISHRKKRPISKSAAPRKTSVPKKIPAKTLSKVPKSTTIIPNAPAPAQEPSKCAAVEPPKPISTPVPALASVPNTVLAPITQLPSKVFVRQPGQPETVIDWWLTIETLNDLIGQYLNGTISRLAMSWGKSRDLVLLHDKGQHDITLKPDSGSYACLFFDHTKSNWYALVSLPEVYAVVDEKDVVYVPFGLGILPNYMIHTNTARIKQHLNEAVSIAANKYNSPTFMTWSPQVYRFETNPRYHVAKRLYGGYSAEQEPCRLNAAFYIPVAPVCLAYANCSGTQANNAYKPRNKSEAQEALVSYMMGKLSLLILTWRFAEPNEQEASIPQSRHIILLQDHGCHQMLYLDDNREYLSYLISNVDEYMNAEGNHYRKTTFREQTVPAYLVHNDLRRIRDYTDLLLAQIKSPNAILNLFGEFSYGGKSYHAVAEEFSLKGKNT